MKNLTFLLVMALGAMPATPTQAAESQVLNSSQGRYAFGQVSDYRKDQYMLDTQTGRLWRMTCVATAADKNSKDKQGDCSFSALEMVPYIHGQNQYNVLPPAVPTAPPR